MEAKFSGALMITDLDDFITPSQNCIRPVQSIAKPSNFSAVEMDIDNGEFVQINTDGSREALKQTKIQLADCLACSGCVTSAESILVNQQSVEQFLSIIQKVDLDRLVVISISPQSRASIAARYGISDPMEAMRRLVSFCKNYLSANYVFDTTWSRHLSLLEMCEEFVQRYKQQNDAATLPLLTSACPGWICYAEKAHPEILPYISTSKSPQQIMGTLVKDFLLKYHSKNSTSSAKSIYHVTIMPCFDKKLEAARDDFKNVNWDSQDVDLVLTSSELDHLLRLKGFNSLKEVEMSDSVDPYFNELFTNNSQFALGNLTGTSGSGGYAEVVFRYAASKLFNVNNIDKINYKIGRNEDYKEFFLEIEGKKVLHFVEAYGFRNIQNLVRKMNNKVVKPSFHFVEVMACPSGCLNGGGQINAPELVSKKEFLKQVETVYKNTLVQYHSPLEVADKNGVAQFYLENFNGATYGSLSKQYLHTVYHNREKAIINPLAIKW